MRNLYPPIKVLDGTLDLNIVQVAFTCVMIEDNFVWNFK